MKIRTLEKISEDKILDVFNHSFSDYLIPLHLKPAQLSTKIKTENIQLNMSVGAFDGNHLVGFILHGLNADKGIVYNGGTGVIPEYRGNGLTKDMYKFILPELKTNSIRQLVLEVISNNEPAIRSYEKIGFQKVRDLLCYKGELSITAADTSYDIKTLDDFQWEELESFWDVAPAWQYTRQTMELSKPNIALFGAFLNKVLIGYALVNTQSHRLNQLAVSKEHRRKGVATALLHRISKQMSNNLSMINVDASISSLNSCLEKSGLAHFLTQYEMKMDIWN